MYHYTIANTLICTLCMQLQLYDYFAIFFLLAKTLRASLDTIKDKITIKKKLKVALNKESSFN